MDDPRLHSSRFATIVSKVAILIHLDRTLAARHPARRYGRCVEPVRARRGQGTILEKLEEAPRFTVMHGRAERDAHPNLIEINVFGGQLFFDYGSTSIIETL
jgi:hypothetical protein